MIPNFQDQLAEAARSFGIDRARGDHQINTLIAMRPVEIIQNLVARAATLSGEQRTEYVAEIEQRTRAFVILGDALKAHVLAAFAAMNEKPTLLASRAEPVSSETE